MNVERQQLRRAWTIKEGIGLALGRGDIPKRYAEAITSTPEEAEELCFKINKGRQVSKTLAKYGFS